MIIEIDELSISDCPLKKDCCIEYGEICPHFVQVADRQVFCDVGEEEDEEV